MYPKINQLVTSAREEDQVFPGCVIGVLVGERQFVFPFGRFTYEDTSPVVQEDTVYDVASITKAIPTSSLALSLIDQNRLAIDDPAILYLPELEVAQKEDIKVWHLLTQTLDWDLRLSHQKELSPQEMLQSIMSATLKRKPGTSYTYTNTTSVLLGILVERVAKKSLDQLADEEFFDPLAMSHTTFHPERFSKDHVAPSEIDSWRNREIRGEVHDESAYVLREKFVPGSAGLFSTVPDLLAFLTMLIHKGVYQGRRFFTEKIVEKMMTNQIAHLHKTTGLGWELEQPWYMGRYASEHTFGKTGFTGCHVLVDIPKQKALVLLSNSTYPKRPESKDALHAVRRALADIIFAE